MAKVAVVGSGFIGRAWAIVFARGGQEVHLWDRETGATAAAVSYIESVLGDLAANDLLDGQAPDVILGRLHQFEDLSDALDGVSYIQENTLENLEIKRPVLQELDKQNESAA